DLKPGHVLPHQRMVDLEGLLRQRLGTPDVGAIEDRFNPAGHPGQRRAAAHRRDRKSTRLNSSHVSISYAVFCLKKKKKNQKIRPLLAQLEKLFICDLSPSTNDSVKN